MSDEKYLVDIGEEGSIGLGKLDYCFNLTTKEFLLQLASTGETNRRYCK